MHLINNPVLKLLVAFLLLMNITFCQKNEENNTSYVFPSDTSFLKTYVRDHPRLILTKNRIPYLQSLAKNDTLLNRYVTQCINDAKTRLYGALPVYYSRGILT